jgi:peptide/nickel transport system ATP-binding protein
LSATETVLDISGLTVRLPAHADRAHAIEDVSLTVRRGEIVCIVGESGSGKSVTAFSIMGLLPKGELAPVAGEIRLDGEDVLKATPARLRRLRGARMAMIFQEPMTALNPVETIGEQIDEVLRIHTELSDRERKAKVIEILTAMRLPDPKRLYDAYPHQISGGQRQRIMIAAAMVLDPHLLIADEPTTALDVTTQAQILALIKDLQRRHDTGVLFITHDFGVVADIAHRVVVMQRGRVVEEGPAEEVLKHPRHDYTRMLIAAIPSLDPKPLDPKTGPITLETVKLGKSYGGGLWRKDRVVAAAQDVNLQVRRGETLGIVGESGSGKTTVARCVARLIAPSTGAIRVNDIDIAPLRERQLRPYRRRVQVVFQDPYRSLNPRRTVGASIVEGPMNFGLAEGEALLRARSLLALVGLSPGVLDRYPHQFSGGQRQRIAIARALAMEPEILIADEAVSALDVSVQAQVLELLDDVKQRFDLAVLFITHDLRVAAQICDRIIVMEKGIVFEAGATHRVYTAPQHPYTRALLDAAPGRNFAFGKVP